MKQTIILTCGLWFICGCATERTTVDKTSSVPATRQNVDPRLTYDGKAMTNSPPPFIPVAPDEVLKPKR